MNGYTPISGSLQRVWDRISKATVTQPTVLTETNILQFIGEDAGWIVVAYQSAEDGVVMLLDNRQQPGQALFVATAPTTIISQLP